jgi:glycosyltransferase involved in cell wall biosynthesis
MIKNPVTLSIFFPTYNEEENIAESIEKAVSVAEHSPFIEDYEVIVVNDGSSDNTQHVAEQYAAKNPKVRVVTHAVNRGYGAALVTGFATATKEYVFYTDADLQFDMTEVNNLLIHIDAADAVIGYRAPRKDPLMRILNAKGWNILNRLFFGLKIRDIDCAFKIFPTHTIQQVRFHAEGAMTSAESLIRLSRMGVSFKQVPVSHLPRVAGSQTGAKLSVIFRAFREMMQLYRGDLGLQTQKQAIRFGMVGVVNTVVDICIYVFLTRIVHLDSITLAKLFAFLGGTVSSFLLNRAYTFGIRSKFSVAEVARFYTVVSLSLLVNVGIMTFLTSILHIYDLIALLGTTLFTFAVSFTLTRAWVFIKDTDIESSSVRANGVPYLTTPQN